MVQKQTISPAAIVAGAAAAAAAAAGAYWLYGSKDAPKHRKLAKSWMLKARAEALEALEKVAETAGTIDKETYMNIVDTVLKRYRSAKGVTSIELDQVSKDLKNTWAHMQKAYKEAGKAKSGAKTVAKKVKKAAKKKR